MKRKSIMQQPVLHFFLTKMIAGVAVIVALVVLVEWLRSFLLDRTNLSNGSKDLIIAVAEAYLATAAYIYLFRTYDKRSIDELSRAKFLINSISGFFTGLLLQSFFILIIYLFGT